MNPPEQRGSTGAFFHFTDQLGSATGLLLGSLLLAEFDYLLVFSFFMIFYFVAALFWAPSIKTATKESDDLREKMHLRAQTIDQGVS